MVETITSNPARSQRLAYQRAPAPLCHCRAANQPGVPVLKDGVTIMAVTAIDDYEVMYSSTPFVPRIWLISQGNFIGQLIFMPDGTPLPGDTPGNLYYHLEDFENLLGILATDKPTYLLFVGTGPGNENGILTAAEPVGEGVTI